jgi:hypothetical protein
MRQALFSVILVLCGLSANVHAQAFPDGHGKITSKFAAQLLPVLHAIGELKPGGSYSPAMLANIAALDKLTSNTDEGALMAFMKDELARYIQAEKKPVQTAKRQHCVQDLTGQAKRLEYTVTTACGDISNSMY